MSDLLAVDAGFRLNLHTTAKGADEKGASPGEQTGQRTGLKREGVQMDEGESVPFLPNPGASGMRISLPANHASARLHEASSFSSQKKRHALGSYLKHQIQVIEGEKGCSLSDHLSDHAFLFLFR